MLSEAHRIHFPEKMSKLQTQESQPQLGVVAWSQEGAGHVLLQYGVANMGTVIESFVTSDDGGGMLSPLVEPSGRWKRCKYLRTGADRELSGIVEWLDQTFPSFTLWWLQLWTRP